MIFNVIVTAVPLMFASLGALVSEYAGVLAVFIDGVINFSAFLTYTFTVWTGNVFFAICLSALCSSLSIFLFAIITEKVRMNPFLSATALNLFYSSMTSVLSSLIFKTRGVLASPAFQFDHFATGVSVSGLALLVCVFALLFLFRTPHGIYLRITGSDSDVLEAKGISSMRCRIYAWGLSALFASMAGSVLALKIQSFVPNISAGRGWISLAIIFIGKKKLPFVAAAVLVFCAAEYFGITLQSFLPSTAINSIPYLVALVLIAVQR